MADVAELATKPRDEVLETADAGRCRGAATFVTQPANDIAGEAANAGRCREALPSVAHPRDEVVEAADAGRCVAARFVAKSRDEAEEAADERRCCSEPKFVADPRDEAVEAADAGRRGIAVPTPRDEVVEAADAGRCGERQGRAAEAGCTPKPVPKAACGKLRRPKLPDILKVPAHAAVIAPIGGMPSAACHGRVPLP